MAAISSSSSRPLPTQVLDSNHDNGPVGLAQSSTLLFGFLITFIVLFVAFMACGIGSRRYTRARRLEARAAADRAAEQVEPRMYEVDLSNKSDGVRWEDILPLSATLYTANQPNTQNSHYPPSSFAGPSSLPQPQPTTAYPLTPNDATSPSPLTQILYPPRALLPEHTHVQDEHYHDLPFFRRNTRHTISFLLSRAPFSHRPRPPSPPKAPVITAVEVAVVIAMPDPLHPMYVQADSPEDPLSPETSKSGGKVKESEAEIVEVDRLLPEFALGTARIPWRKPSQPEQT